MPMTEAAGRLPAVFGGACIVGVFGGLLGIGGGALLVPLLGLVFHYEQHRAQGTSLVALVLPTGLLAFVNYWRAGAVDWKIGLLLMPGVFLGGMLGSQLAHRIRSRHLRRVFAASLIALGAWQAVSSWVHW